MRGSVAVEQGRGHGGGALRLFAAFALAVAVPVVGLGLVLDATYRADALERTLRDAGQQTQVVAETAVVPAISDQDLRTGLDLPAMADLGAAVDTSVREHRVVRLRVLGPDGNLVYPPSEPGQAVHTAAVRQAAAGHVDARVETLSAADVAAYHYRGQVLRVVAPLMSPSSHHVIGVVEVLLPYNTIARTVARQQHVFATILCAGLAVVYLLIAVITWVVTSRLRRQAKASEHQSLHDALTGLPNRAYFRQAADRALAQTAAPGSHSVLVVADLDRFKEVNDGLGHHCGDELLVEVARRVRSVLRTDDVVARLGGDEFGFVLPGTSIEQARTVMEHVRELVRAPVTVSGVEVVVDVSVGLAGFPEHGTDVPGLLQNADVAMYAAKSAGCGVVAYDDDTGAGGKDRLSLASDLRSAVTGDELVVHYQPKLRLSDGSVREVEALVRWAHPRRGLLAPGEFLPVAEDSDLVDQVFLVVLRQVLADRADRPWLTVAVNVSARTLLNACLPEMVAAELDRAGAPADALVLELTETAAVRSIDTARDVLARLRGMGVGISLDDFGQGQTSLAYLRQLPFTELKVDRTFVERVLDPGEAAIVEGVVTIAHRLGMQVVAEGVEDERRLLFLRDLGCDVVQGYHVARPMPLAALDLWLAARPDAAADPTRQPEPAAARGASS